MIESFFIEPPPIEDNNNTSPTNDEPRYSDQTIKQLRMIYIGAAIFWIIFITCIIGTCNIRGLSGVIVIIPFIVFLISYISLPKVVPLTEKTLQRTNYLSLGLLIFFPIFSTLITKYRANRELFVKLMCSAFIFSLIGLYDVWVPPDYVPHLRHIKTIFQTYTVTILLLAMNEFYINEVDPMIVHKNKTIALV